ncbi:MAG TPA: plasmid pRiA4b ORF-3 family protein [Acidimicrobiales bacterium]
MPTPPEHLTLQLRVELDEVVPTIWRQILVPTSVRMSRLHDMIQAAMGWTNSHLHAFSVGDARYGMCFDEYPEGEVDEQTVTVLQALRGRQQFTYEYDFGDGWEHTITVEAELRSPHALKFAVCLAGENACPPEDSGGPGGFEYFLEALADPQHEEHENYVRWNDGDTFDRTAFNLIEVNASLQKVRQRSGREPEIW